MQRNLGQGAERGPSRQPRMKPPVGYLQANEFTRAGDLDPQLLLNGPIFVMIQTQSCPACQRARPIFQQLANSWRRVRLMAIQIDGDLPGERAFTKRPADNAPPLLERVYPRLPGVPSFVLFTPSGGKYFYDGDIADEETLTRFIRSHV